jgi:nitrous oxidase accessory protein
MVVWYSERIDVRANTVTGGRYGTHFMYCSDTTVEGNRYFEDVVGVFVMYSHRITLADNVLARAGGAAGVGLGVKESGGLRVRGNLIAHDTVGIYLDNSPLDVGESNEFAGNAIRACGTGIAFHGSGARNAFAGNRLQDNAAQVEVHGGGDALAVAWRGNWFDDYQGYDLDGDGFGDVPYQVSRLSTELTGRYPNVAFLRGTPALDAIDLAARVMPLLRAKVVLVDERPRMLPPAATEVSHGG